MICSTLVCVATSVEAKACQKGISRSGRADQFEILQTGMGMKQARSALEKRLSDLNRPRPTRVVSTGFAGSWTRELSVGSWILGESVELHGENALLELGSASRHSRILSPALAAARVLTLAQASSHENVIEREDPAKLPVAVDMESFAWAEICAREALPFHIIRLISDNPDAPLPQAVSHFASIATASGPTEKLRHLAQGLAQLARQPHAMAGFVMRGTKLPGLLAQGWQEIYFE